MNKTIAVNFRYIDDGDDDDDDSIVVFNDESIILSMVMMDVVSLLVIMAIDKIERTQRQYFEDEKKILELNLIGIL